MGHVKCEVLTAVAMKCYIFWDITPCSPVKVSEERITSSFKVEYQYEEDIKQSSVFVLESPEKLCTDIFLQFVQRFLIMEYAILRNPRCSILCNLFAPVQTTVLLIHVLLG
jgi:hypothetical protein